MPAMALSAAPERKYPMTLTDHFQTDFTAAKDNHERSTVVRYWRRAALETMYDRSLSSYAMPAPRKARFVRRYIPFWLAVADDELAGLMALIDRRYLIYID